MWLYYAIGSAVFAGITSIIAKVGMKKTDSDLATAIRTIVVLICSCVMVRMVGSYETIHSISKRSFEFLILSGLATGASWLCYFKALQLGDVNKVAPIDKSSTVLTMLLAFLFLGEQLTPYRITAMVAIGIGTYMMITKQKTSKRSKSKAWLIYAILSAVFASLTAVLAKIGIDGVESNLGTAIRTFVVLIMAWLIVFVKGKQKELKYMTFKSGIFICLSGLTTGLSWLCYYRALQMGEASVVVPIDKLSIVLTVIFSSVFLKEHLSKKAFAGLVLIVAGTMLLLI